MCAFEDERSSSVLGHSALVEILREKLRDCNDISAALLVRRREQRSFRYQAKFSLLGVPLIHNNVVATITKTSQKRNQPDL
jgi:hypothetical protein